MLIFVFFLDDFSFLVAVVVCFLPTIFKVKESNVSAPNPSLLFKGYYRIAP